MRLKERNENFEFFFIYISKPNERMKEKKAQNSTPFSSKFLKTKKLDFC